MNSSIYPNPFVRAAFARKLNASNAPYGRMGTVASEDVLATSRTIRTEGNV